MDDIHSDSMEEPKGLLEYKNLGAEYIQTSSVLEICTIIL